MTAACRRCQTPGRQDGDSGGTYVALSNVRSAALRQTGSGVGPMLGASYPDRIFDSKLLLPGGREALR